MPNANYRFNDLENLLPLSRLKNLKRLQLPDKALVYFMGERFLVLLHSCKILICILDFEINLYW